jgi:hypothetical protein
MPRIRKGTAQDKVLNFGITGKHEEKLDFYVFDVRTLSTFRKSEAERLEKETHYKVQKVISVPTLSYIEFVKTYIGREIDLLSIDVEGFDFEIIASIPGSPYRPKIICIETLTFATNNLEEKITDTIELIKGMDYLLIADTYINSIFVDRETWRNR